VIQESEDKIVLLDGQQRLATATILLAAMRNIARGLDSGNDHAGGDFARDIQKELIQKDEEFQGYVLTLGDLDAAFFEASVQRDSPDPPYPPTLRSHKLIIDAYQYLESALKVTLTNLSPSDALQKLKRYKNCLTKGLTMVAILVTEEEAAFAIFETLNDRGLRLSVPDLLLNLLMRRAVDGGERQNVRQDWNSMLQRMGRRDIAQFIRHMWVSKYGDLKARGLYSEIKRYLGENSIRSIDFAKACSEECQDYLSLLEVGDRIPGKARNDVDGLVNHLRVLSSFPLLLSGLRCLNDSDFVKLARYAAALAIRHQVIANLNPLDLETAFYRAAREIRGKKLTGENSANCLSSAKRELVAVNPDDSRVLQSAKDLYLTRSAAAWLVANLANSYQSRTREVAVDAANLEHVFPENPGTDWTNRADLEPYLWHLGNLTVLGERLNNRAANAGFVTKRDEYYTKSEIVMTRDLTSQQEWTAETILERGGTLASQILRVWPGP
jgi:hypothetical protein